MLVPLANILIEVTSPHCHSQNPFQQSSGKRRGSDHRGQVRHLMAGDHFTFREQKTGKLRDVTVNRGVQEALQELLRTFRTLVLFRRSACRTSILWSRPGAGR